MVYLFHMSLYNAWTQSAVQQNGRRRVGAVDTESNILDSSLKLIYKQRTNGGVAPIELQPT